jgi:hypothetical protein
MTKPTVEELLEWIATAKNHYPRSPSVEVVCNALRERLVGEQQKIISTSALNWSPKPYQSPEPSDGKE